MQVRGAARCSGRERGMSLTELIVVVCIVGILMAATVPPMINVLRTAAMASLSRRLSSLMLSCRARAVFQRQAVALVFEQDQAGNNERWRCFIVEDGDGDGVRRDDINQGRDRRVSEVLGLRSGGAGLGILQEEPVPDPGGRGFLSGDLNDPVRAGRGDIITFSKEGTATPCSVYLTDNHSSMRVIRVYGATGKIHLWQWRLGWSKWKRPAT